MYSPFQSFSASVLLLNFLVSPWSTVRRSLLTWKFQLLIREDSRSLYALGFHDQGVLLSRSTSVPLRETTWEMVAIYFLSLVLDISVRFDRGRSPSIANFRRQSHALMWSSDCLVGQANIKWIFIWNTHGFPCLVEEVDAVFHFRCQNYFYRPAPLTTNLNYVWSVFKIW